MKNYSYEIILIILIAICSMAFFFLPGCTGDTTTNITANNDDGLVNIILDNTGTLTIDQIQEEYEQSQVADDDLVIG